MNSQLIEKIITSNNLSCPTFSYENPVLDKNVAKTLSKSFVKILNLSKQNSKVNNNLRLSILENIRKLCQIEPENHLKINNDLGNILTEFYEQKLKTEKPEPVERVLDKFLIDHFKEINISSTYQPSLKPETVQALINLNPSGCLVELLVKDVILWNCIESKYAQIVKNLWDDENVNLLSKHTIVESVPVKLKLEIERLLIDSCSVLKEKDFKEVIHSAELQNLIKKCTESANCFQICCNILNYLFIMSNFCKHFEGFIQMFVQNVKRRSNVKLSELYAFDLSHIVILLDIDLNELPECLKVSYVQSALKYLCELHKKDENNFIMLLCHFPEWFDIYFEQ